MVAGRTVCPQVFCDNWAISRAQLVRYVRMVKEGHREISHGIKGTGQQRESVKRNFVVTWFIQYASEVTEKLPDSDCVLLPRMHWSDLYKSFYDDMVAAGHSGNEIAKIDHFKNTFAEAKELSHMQMTTYKRNFAKCSTCVKLTAAVLSSHSPTPAYHRLPSPTPSPQLAHHRPHSPPITHHHPPVVS